MEQEYIVETLDNLEVLSQKIIKIIEQKHIVIFKGDLGSGKTTLIKMIVKQLRSKDHVSSPSFSIINEYRTDQKSIFHFDLYRIKEIEELEEIGFFDYLDSGNYCFIEWPEIIEDYLDMPYIEIKISIMENNYRNILILS